MEASGHARWFERLLAELGWELWIGQIRRRFGRRSRKQKTGRARRRASCCDADGGRFERLRIWVPRAEERDLRQLVLHRHRLVELRTRVKKPNCGRWRCEGVGANTGAVEPEGAGAVSALALPAWTIGGGRTTWSCWRKLMRRTNPLDQAVEQEAARRPR